MKFMGSMVEFSSTGELGSLLQNLQELKLAWLSAKKSQIPYK